MIVLLDRAIVTCLCLLIFLLPMLKAAVEVFSWLAFVLWVAKRALGDKTDGPGGIIPKTDLNKVLGLLLAANALSVIFSVHIASSLRGLFGKELKFIVIYFLVVGAINSRKRLECVLVACMASVGLIMTDAIVQYITGTNFIGHIPLWGTEIFGNFTIRGARLSSCFSNPNDFAGWLNVYTPVFLALIALPARNWLDWIMKVLLSVLVFLLLASLLLTYTRGAWLGVMCGFSVCIFYCVRNPEFRKRTVLFLIPVSLFVALILPCPQKKIEHPLSETELTSEMTVQMKAVLNANAQSMKIQKAPFANFAARSSQAISERLHSTHTVGIRKNLWKEAMIIIGEHPLFGCGLNAYGKAARTYKDFDKGYGYPHNCFLQMTAETGFVGLFFFLVVLLKFFKKGFEFLNQKVNLSVLGLLSGILAFLVHSFFDTNLYSLRLVALFWYMLGLTIAVMKIETK